MMARKKRQPPPGSRRDDDRRARSEAFVAALQAGEHELIDRAVQQMIDEMGAERSLAEEIGALRVVLRRLVAMDALEGDPAETALTMARLVDAISRANRTDRALSGKLADNLDATLTSVLQEMGLGDGEGGE